MKILMKLILGLAVLFPMSCSTTKSDKPETITTSEKEEQPDTNKVYWEIDTDTLRSFREVQVGNDKHVVELKIYSLNDSSIIKINSIATPVHVDIYHDVACDIVMRKGDSIVLQTQIRKLTFKDGLEGDFLKYSVLKSVEIKPIRSNRLYFSAELSVPETDWVTSLEFAIFYRTNKKGQLDFWSVKAAE